MKSHPIALLLLGFLALRAEPGSASMKKRIAGGNQHQERERGMDETPFQTPAPPTSGPNGPPNPGQCPSVAPGLPRPTHAYCSEGLACPGDEKCCLVRNTRKCVLPDGVHPGYCPRGGGGAGGAGGAGGETVSSKACSKDTDCARHEKCCLKHRRQKCTHAVPAHPGLCPKTRLGRVFVPCKNQCKDDRDCAPGKKCCFSLCGLRCVSRETHQDEEPDQGEETPLERLWRGATLHPRPDFCRLPLSVGSTCNATSGLRVFYNSQAGLCEKFIYRGCGGNENNFATQLECLQTCSNPNICQLPKDKGFGDAFRPRFYYDSALKTCQRFLYAGHGGNANNFWEEGFCLQFCARDEAGR
nr:papilin-like [Pogona vitticeps]